MDITAAALPLAAFGALLGVVMLVPQIVRTVRHRHLEGVSALSWSLLAITCSAWLVYGIHAQVWPQVPGNILLVSGAWAIVLLVPHRWSPARRAVLLGAATAVLVAVSWALPPAVGGYLAFGLGLTAAWPQVVETWGLRHDPDASGLSLPSFGLRLASQSCWWLYAVLAVDVPVLLSATVAIGTTAFVVGVELRRRAQAPAGAPLPELVCEPA